MSCACHWTVGVAASKGNGKLYADVYSVAPSGVFVPANSPVKTPEDLAGVPIAVGYQSGSHYSTIQALEQYMPADKINLTFADGMLFQRLDQLLDGKTQASALFSGPYYFAEQLGFRKIIDTTFMIATMVTGDPDPEDLRKFFRALRRAQRDIDLRPDLYTHYYKNEFPVRYHAMMDTRRWGPGERLVFEPYTKEVYEETFKWIADHGIFADTGMGSGKYERGRRSRLAHVIATTLTDGRRDRSAPALCRAMRALSVQPRRAVRSAVERRVILQQVRRARAMHDAPRSSTIASLGQRQRDLGMLLDQDDGGAFVGDHSPDRAQSSSSTMIGASPSSGSSSSSSAGLVISARAIASICCSPPER